MGSARLQAANPGTDPKTGEPPVVRQRPGWAAELNRNHDHVDCDMFAGAGPMTSVGVKKNSSAGSVELHEERTLRSRRFEVSEEVVALMPQPPLFGTMRKRSEPEESSAKCEVNVFKALLSDPSLQANWPSRVSPPQINPERAELMLRQALLATI